MLSRDEVLLLLRAHLPELRREYGVGELALFGSIARGAETEESDIDIIAEFDRPIGLRFVEFAERLEQILGMQADVLTPAGVSGIRNPSVAQRIQESVIRV